MVCRPRSRVSLARTLLRFFLAKKYMLFISLPPLFLMFAIVVLCDYAQRLIVVLHTNQVNKYIHIYLGWFAYGAGLIQCYRGVELVSGSDSLVFSAAEIDFTVRGCFSINLINGGREEGRGPSSH